MLRRKLSYIPVTTRNKQKIIPHYFSLGIGTEARVRAMCEWASKVDDLK